MRQALRTVSRTVKASLTELKSTLTYYKIRLLYPHVQLGQNVRFYGPIQLQIAKTATVCIGDNVVFRSSTKHNFVGINRPVSIYVAKGATLSIGSDCGFSGTAIYAATHISIGRYCNFGGNSSLWDTDFHPLDYQLRRMPDAVGKAVPITVDEDAFIGANTIILKGVIIGKRAIIGAGSVVSKRVPDDQVWAGNPAKNIK